MRVIINHKEILEACIEWATKHHGLRLSGSSDMRVKIKGAQGASTDRIYFVEASSIEFSEAHGSQPYRDPDTK